MKDEVQNEGYSDFSILMIHSNVREKYDLSLSKRDITRRKASK